MDNLKANACEGGQHTIIEPMISSNSLSRFSRQHDTQRRHGFGNAPDIVSEILRVRTPTQLSMFRCSRAESSSLSATNGVLVVLSNASGYFPMNGLERTCSRVIGFCDALLNVNVQCCLQRGCHSCIPFTSCAQVPVNFDCFVSAVLISPKTLGAGTHIASAHDAFDNVSDIH
jgi:hypothetical protein